jgi:predicted nucleotidyltransferase
VADTDTARERLRDLLEERREQILAAAARHHGRRVRVFGSVARGKERTDSDIDLLVDFDEGSSLFDLMHLSRELEELLGTSIDVVSSGGLKPRDQHILAEAVDL